MSVPAVQTTGVGPTRNLFTLKKLNTDIDDDGDGPMKIFELSRSILSLLSFC